jgi:hypothetical protein
MYLSLFNRDESSVQSGNLIRQRLGEAIILAPISGAAETALALWGVHAVTTREG